MRSKSVLRRGATVLAASVVTAAALLTGTASAAPTSGVGVRVKCGYDTDLLGINAYYTHCDPHTYVVIKIIGEPWVESERCVGPGETKLGSTINYHGAYYAGRLC